VEVLPNSSRLRSKWSENTLRLAIVALACILAAVTAVTETRGAFVGTTANGGSSAAAGTVSLIDDDLGSALLSVTNLKPLDVLTKCITVTYQGTITPAVVKLYGAAGGSGLGSYLTTVVDMGTGGQFGDCTGFVSQSTLFSCALSTLTSTNTNYSNGLTAFTAAASPTTKTFRFIFTVLDNNLAQGLNVTPTFTWEAQNS